MTAKERLYILFFPPKLFSKKLSASWENLSFFVLLFNNSGTYLTWKILWQKDKCKLHKTLALSLNFIYGTHYIEL